MKRRSYLAGVAATTLAGCTASPIPDNTTVDWEGTGTDGEEPIDGPAEGETFDDFEDLSEWTVVEGSLYRVEDDEHATGDQSAFLEVGESGSVRISRELSPPVDLSGMSPGLAMATDSPVSPYIQVNTADGGRFDFRQRSGANRSLVRKTFGIGDVSGLPDMGAVTGIAIGLRGEEGTQLWIDDLHFVDRPARGRVLLQFDGGFENHYTNAFPLVDEYGYPATTFVPAARIREDVDHDGTRLTENQLDTLFGAGWTIGSYTMRGLDLTDQSDAEREAELGDAAERLAEFGFGDGSRYVSFPLGRYDDGILSLAADHYDLGFAGAYPAQGRATNPLLCSKYPHPDVEDAKEVLDLTAQFGGITALNYANVGDDSVETLEEVLSSLHELESEGELEVITLAEFEEQFVV